MRRSGLVLTREIGVPRQAASSSGRGTPRHDVSLTSVVIKSSSVRRGRTCARAACVRRCRAGDPAAESVRRQRDGVGRPDRGRRRRRWPASLGGVTRSESSVDRGVAETTPHRGCGHEHSGGPSTTPPEPTRRSRGGRFPASTWVPFRAPAAPDAAFAIREVRRPSPNRRQAAAAPEPAVPASPVGHRGPLARSHPDRPWRCRHSPRQAVHLTPPAPCCSSGQRTHVVRGTSRSGARLACLAFARLPSALCHARQHARQAAPQVRLCAIDCSPSQSPP